MIFGIKDCLDFKLFTEEGKEVYHMDYACDSELSIRRDAKSCLLGIGHEVIDFELLELINGNGSDKSDFENALGEIDIDFGMHMNDSKYKAIGVFTVRMEDGRDKKVTLIFNNVRFFDGLSDIKFDPEKIHKYNTLFEVLPDEDGRFFKMKSHV